MSQIQLSREEFDQLLTEAIDETLVALGEPVKNQLYFQLEHAFGIKKTNLAAKFTDFLDILHKIFGLRAARLEEAVMKKLDCKLVASGKLARYEALSSDWAAAEFSCTEYVCHMRNKSKVLQENVKTSVLTMEDMLENEIQAMGL